MDCEDILIVVERARALATLLDNNFFVQAHQAWAENDTNIAQVVCREINHTGSPLMYLLLEQLKVVYDGLEEEINRQYSKLNEETT